MRHIIIASLCLLAAACARTTWNHPVTLAHFDQDHYECYREASVVVAPDVTIVEQNVDTRRSGSSGGGFDAFAKGAVLSQSRPKTHTDRQLYNACMKARGYVRVR